MNTEEDTNEAPDGATGRVPLGYWLRVVDSLLTREVNEAFAAEGASRRDWMLLNALAGDADAPLFTPAHRGRRLGEFVERGWVAETDDGWELTDEGRAAHERLGAIVERLRERVAGAVSPEDYATMTASLEAIARELGWDEEQGMPRGRGFWRGRGPGFGRGWGPGFARGFGHNHGHGFGPGFGRGFGPGFGRGFAPGYGRGYAPGYGFGPWQGYGGWGGFAPEYDPRQGYGPAYDPRHGFGPDVDHPHHHGHPGHRRGKGRGKDAGDAAQRAYERGFAAGLDAAKRDEQPSAEASDPGI